MYDEKEVLSLWEKVQSEPSFLQPKNTDFTEKTSQNSGKETDISDVKFVKKFPFFTALLTSIVYCGVQQRTTSYPTCRSIQYLSLLQS